LRRDRTRTVWVNGRLEPEDAALLSVTDRGFQVGDGIFETIRVVGGRVLELPLHASRLQASAAVLEIRLPDGLERCLDSAIAEVCRANVLDEPGAQVAVRVTASRGPVQGRGLRPPVEVRPNLVVQAWRVEPPAPDMLARGLSLVISAVRRDPLSPLAKVKTTSRAEFVYAQLEALHRGDDDALFLTTDGHLAEATSASVFLVVKGTLVTPSLDCGILVSTTREWVISSGAPMFGLAVREDRLAPGELFAAEEAFLASSVAGILPVSSVDRRPIGAGRPGDLTLRLRAAREEAALGES
jgi:branched-subunit amino acid aminotransferase/4-amino-4-deoxychorismate lyase